MIGLSPTDSEFTLLQLQSQAQINSRRADIVVRILRTLFKDSYWPDLNVISRESLKMEQTMQKTHPAFAI